jgi:CHASE1-domain containing sensor protein
MASSPRHLLYRYAPLGMTLGLGIGLSIVAASLVSKWEAFNHQVRFQRQIENLTTGLQRSLNRYTDVLLSLSDYYAVADLQVDRQDFAQFVQRSLASYPGIQALEWSDRRLNNKCDLQNLTIFRSQNWRAVCWCGRAIDRAMFPSPMWNR